MSDADYPGSYYAASANTDLDCRALRGTRRVDVAVVGGGFTGISAALELAERGFSVAVVEARRVGWGASGRNGGQLLCGGFGEPEAIAKRYGDDAARLARSLGQECVGLVRKRIDSHRIDCELRNGAFSAALNDAQLKRLRKRFDALQQDTAGSTSWYPRARVHEIVGTDRYVGGFLDRSDGHLHPLKLCLAEARLARAGGVEIYERTPVVEIRHGSNPIARTASGEIKAEFLVIACNAYLAGLEPALAGRVLPAGSFIVATEPLDAAMASLLLPENSAVSDENVLLDYYRLSADRRLLFGGRYSYTGRAPVDVVPALKARLTRVFPALADVGIDYAWGGKIGISLNRMPQIGRLGPTVYYAHGYSGHGVAQSHMAGRLLAEAIAGQAERFDVYAAFKSPRLPAAGRLAPAALGLVLLYFRLRDALGR